MDKDKKNTGKLYVIATPIGNIEDITMRAIRIMKNTSLILCEDTRSTKKLLKHYDIKAKLKSCHSYNEENSAQDIIKLLKEGQNIAVVSEAGTPGISDPGSIIVKSAMREGIFASPVPGPSALTATLSVSGAQSSKILFFGFLPKIRGKRIREFKFLKRLNLTSILYESPKRILKTLEEIDAFLPERKIFIARETTKPYEEFLCGSPSEIMRNLTSENLKGEFTLVIFPGEKTDPSDSQIREKTLKIIKKLNLSTSDTAKLLAAEFDVPKKNIYKMISELKEQGKALPEDE